MNTRMDHLCKFAFITLLCFFGLTASSGAQVSISPRSNRDAKLQRDLRKTNSEQAASSPYSVLYDFCTSPNCTDGGVPFGSLVEDAVGNLYGTTAVGGNGFDGTVFKVDSAGQETVLLPFNVTDGYEPVAGLIQDAEGNLYGTTSGGGAYYNGTVFELNPTDQETVLYSFCPGGYPCVDGSDPLAGVIQDAAGNLYGTTYDGGNQVVSICDTRWGGCGTVFKVDSAGNHTVLYSFCAAPNCADGYTPMAGVILDAAGNLYGTTFGDRGTVFKVSSTGQETVLYSFCPQWPCLDGESPVAGLIQDAAGNLYGTTSEGGANDGGTLFKLDPSGHETVLYSFCSAKRCEDGAGPSAALIQDSEGNLYGTTVFGGLPWCAPHSNGRGCGTVFKLDTAGQETVLYQFCSQPNCAYGGYPSAGLIRDAAGNLYGTASGGGSGYLYGSCDTGGGTVFKLAPVASVTLTSSPNPSQVNQSVTLTATVNGSYVTPTGTVSFQRGKTVLGVASLTGGVASLTTTFEKTGTFAITAEYSGDQIYEATGSGRLKQIVEQ